MTDILGQLRTGLSDRFEILRELGRGGMAIVYLAHDRRHDRQVALKVLRPELQSSVSGERFLREIRYAAQLQHPHILPLHDSGIVDQAVYYVMPFVDGESLRDRLRSGGRLPIADAVAIALQVEERRRHDRGSHPCAPAHRRVERSGLRSAFPTTLGERTFRERRMTFSTEGALSPAHACRPSASSAEFAAWTEARCSADRTPDPREVRYGRTLKLDVSETAGAVEAAAT